MSDDPSQAPGPLPPAPALFVLVAPGALRVGSCVHCVIHEPGRPERSWEPNGTSELDFDRDAFLAKLAALGVVITDREEYVCP
jgi:hypothetical protein